MRGILMSCLSSVMSFFICITRHDSEIVLYFLNCVYQFHCMRKAFEAHVQIRSLARSLRHDLTGSLLARKGGTVGVCVSADCFICFRAGIHGFHLKQLWGK